MRIFRTECWLPRGQEEVFAFFADAMNLEAITPPWLRFAVLTPGPIEMRVGARIDYHLRWRAVPLRWQTEITRWDPPHAFVDEQRQGPYRSWVHTHTFMEGGGGTWCWDQVRYEVPGGCLVDRALVRRDLERIFTYRHRAMWSHFGQGQPGRTAALSSPD